MEARINDPKILGKWLIGALLMLAAHYLHAPPLPLPTDRAFAVSLESIEPHPCLSREERLLLPPPSDGRKENGEQGEKVDEMHGVIERADENFG
jgi:hypothetical protein